MTEAMRVIDDWTPRLDGSTYCSPACGCRCTLAAYERTVADVDAIVASLGDGWAPHIWENFGWHGEARNGTISVRLDIDGTYDADMGGAMEVARWSGSGETPHAAVAAALAVAEAELMKLHSLVARARSTMRRAVMRRLVPA